ncbi:MAG: PocR ligand-binding domain-containing protein, partial [Deltaproteobacteria bacterium]|nr:PocR ligand-binding domain-containing protein [Deltaproteobacteria bacterium]
MENTIKPVTTESLDLSQWRTFQKGLSELLSIPISLYGSAGEELSPPVNESPVCRKVKSHPQGCELCRQTYRNAVGQVFEKGKTYIYKCHTNQYIFAVPVTLGPAFSVVVVGGHAYLSGSELEEFSRGVAHLGFDAEGVSDLSRRLKTIPPRSVFTLPAIIKNLSAPFLKCLYSTSPSGKAVNGAAEPNARRNGP